MIITLPITWYSYGVVVLVATTSIARCTFLHLLATIDIVVLHATIMLSLLSKSNRAVSKTKKEAKRMWWNQIRLARYDVPDQIIKASASFRFTSYRDKYDLNKDNPDIFGALKGSEVLTEAKVLRGMFSLHSTLKSYVI